MLDRSSRVEVLIELDAGPGDQGDELDRRTEQLGRRLRELDVQDVRRPLVNPEPSGEPNADPPANPTDGTSVGGTGETAAGVLVVQLAPVLPALHDVVHTVRSWLSNYPDRAATLAIDGDQIEVTGAPVDDERELVRGWTERHSPGEL